MPDGDIFFGPCACNPCFGTPPSGGFTPPPGFGDWGIPANGKHEYIWDFRTFEIANINNQSGFFDIIVPAPLLNNCELAYPPLRGQPTVTFQIQGTPNFPRWLTAAMSPSGGGQAIMRVFHLVPTDAFGGSSLTINGEKVNFANSDVTGSESTFNGANAASPIVIPFGVAKSGYGPIIGVRYFT